MSNTLGLILIGLFIGGIVASVVIVDYVAEKHPDTRLGRLAKQISAIIERLPED